MIIGLYATESERLTNRTRGDRLVSETGERKMKREGERESRKREREIEEESISLTTLFDVTTLLVWLGRRKAKAEKKTRMSRFVT